MADFDLLYGLSSIGLDDLQGADLFEELTKKEKAVETVPVIPEEKDMIYEKKNLCPICDAEFLAKLPKAGKTRFLGTDKDLRPVYEGIDVQKYDVLLCPKCGYAALTKFFPRVTPKQATAIRENISSKVRLHTYADDTYTYEEAIERYQLALASAIVKKAKTSEKAYICLKNAWLLRGYAQYLDEEKHLSREQIEAVNQLQKKFYQNAYRGFSEAIQSESYPICGMDEGTLDYLLAAVAIQLDDYDSASRIVGNMLVSTTLNPRIKDKARDLKDEIAQKKKDMAKESTVMQQK
ncbi:MAG: DUF2225 domain-containing protein [Lachnospiraceae bacterium]|nr:DUF2225 domain-containing protein [Lachnospiraceae bacterium]